MRLEIKGNYNPNGTWNMRYRFYMNAIQDKDHSQLRIYINQLENQQRAGNVLSFGEKKILQLMKSTLGF